MTDGINALDYTPFPGNISVAIPEPSTWAMMLIGFAGLGYAGVRQARKARRSEAIV